MRKMWHQSVQTVGAMVKAQPDLKMICNTCGGSFKVPVALLARAYGDDYSLINKRAQCPAYGCAGTCAILHSNGGGSPFMRLGG